MNEPQIPANPREALDFGRLLGERRALAALGGRCSAAHAQLLRRIHNEKLYLPGAPSWRAFCGAYLAISRRHADRLIALLNRFGPTYFELSQLLGITVEQYRTIEPAVRDHSLHVDGAAISVVPENAPNLQEAVGHLLSQSPRTRRRSVPPETLRARAAELSRRGRDLANQLVALYNSAHSDRDREFILESAMEIRLILMQPGLD
jgi:hypothetical protein